MDRRKFLMSAAVGTVATSSMSGLLAGCARASSGHANASIARATANDVLSQTYPFTLPALGYDYDAIEPTVDAATMSIHHDKHHAGYVAGLNDALKTQPALHNTTLRELLTTLSTVPESARNAVQKNGGGHANHAMFWRLLAPGGATAPTGALLAAITKDFGSVSACLAAIKKAGLEEFGSGWTWLVRESAGTLTVRSTPNQDTPLSDGAQVLLGVDVWEHAYYLKYQNRRADYLDAVLGTLDWDAVDEAYSA